jgi:hypothetical protein
MEYPLWRLLISSRSVSKHGYHRNLVGSIDGMSSMKIAHFVLIGLPPHAILVSDWSISKKSSPLKLPGHMNWNLVGSIYMYGRFCIKFPQRMSLKGYGCKRLWETIQHDTLTHILINVQWFYCWSTYHNDAGQ